MKKNKVQQSNRVSYDQVETIIGSDITLVGDITSGGSVRFEGNLKGNVNLSGNLIVGRNGLIAGEVKAGNIHIIGTVQGNDTCEQLKILSTGKLQGDAQVESVIIDEGAIFTGSCKTKESVSEDPSINEILNSVE